MYKLSEMGGGGERGGGEVIREMPERKHSFLKEVFPKKAQNLVACQLCRRQKLPNYSRGLSKNGPQGG